MALATTSRHGRGEDASNFRPRQLITQSPVGHASIDEPDLVTLRVFARRTSLSLRQVQKLTKAGVIRSVTIMRSRRIPRSELERIVREGVR